MSMEDKDPRVVSNSRDYKVIPLLLISSGIIADILISYSAGKRHFNPHWWLVIYSGLALMVFIYLFRFKYLLYADRLEIWYRYTGRIQTIRMNDITSWEERREWLNARRKDKLLTIYINGEKFKISSSNCTDYESLKAILTKGKPLKEDADEMAKLPGRWVISFLNRFLPVAIVISFLLIIILIAIKQKGH